MGRTLESRIASVEHGEALLELFLENCADMPRRVTRDPASGVLSGVFENPYRKVAHWMSTMRGSDVPFSLSLYDGKEQKALYLELFMDVPGDPWGTMASFTPDGDLRFHKSTKYGELETGPLLVPSDKVNIFARPYVLIDLQIDVPPPNWCTLVGRVIANGEDEIQMHSVRPDGETPSYASVVHVPEKHFPVLKRLPSFAHEIRRRRD